MSNSKCLSKDVMLKDCNIIYTNRSVDSIWRNLKVNKIETVNELLDAYEHGKIFLRKTSSIMQLKGIIDLIKFEYFDEISDEMLMTLATPLHLLYQIPSQFTGSTQEEVLLFRRLGFNNSQITSIVTRLKNQPSGKSIIFYLASIDFSINSDNEILFNILYHIVYLLKDMYTKSNQEEIEEETQSLSIPERNSDIEKIRIENFGFIPFRTPENPFFKTCIKKRIMTIGSIMQTYKKNEFLYTSIEDRLYLEGVIDLIKFQYYHIGSEKISSILRQNVALEEKKSGLYLSSKIINKLYRLGFYKQSIEIIQEHLRNFLGKSTVIKLIDFFRDEQRDTSSFSTGTIEYTYYHIISLLIKMFQPYYSQNEENLKRIAYLKNELGNLGERAATLNAGIQECPEEIAIQPNEEEQIKLNMGGKRHDII